MLENKKEKHPESTSNMVYIDSLGRVCSAINLPPKVTLQASPIPLGKEGIAIDKTLIPPFSELDPAKALTVCTSE